MSMTVSFVLIRRIEFRPANSALALVVPPGIAAATLVAELPVDHARVAVITTAMDQADRVTVAVVFSHCNSVSFRNKISKQCSVDDLLSAPAVPAAEPTTGPTSNVVQHAKHVGQAIN